MMFGLEASLTIEIRIYLMNEIDAVSPRFFDNFRDLSDLLAEFGPYNGRYVANYPSDWEKKLLDHLTHLSEFDQLKAKQKLSRYNSNGIKSILININKLEYSPNISWTENVEALQKNKTFNDVIADLYDEGAIFQKWEDKVEEYRAKRERSIHLQGKPGEYIALIEPLLKKGPAAYFVDPYFRPTDEDNISLIKKLFEKVANSECYQLHFFIRKKRALEKNNHGSESKWDLDEYKKELEYCLSRFVRRGKSLTINLFEESKEFESHNRYFITKYGALDFGKGFMRFNYSVAQIPVYIVDKGQHEELIDWYISGKAAFKNIDTITIENNDL